MLIVTLYHQIGNKTFSRDVQQQNKSLRNIGQMNLLVLLCVMSQSCPNNNYFAKRSEIPQLFDKTWQSLKSDKKQENIFGSFCPYLWPSSLECPRKFNQGFKIGKAFSKSNEAKAYFKLRIIDLI